MKDEFIKQLGEAWSRITKCLMHNEQPSAEDLDIVNKGNKILHTIASDPNLKVVDLSDKRNVLFGTHVDFTKSDALDDLIGGENDK